MKAELSTFARTHSRVWRGRRIASWIATVALGAWSAFVLNAAVIDDFEDGAKFYAGGGDMDYFTWQVTGGQLVVSKLSPVPSPPTDALLTYDSVYWSVPGFAGSLDEGRTLELRVDLVHASADDLLSLLICNGSAGVEDYGYAVAVDRNEVALIKYRGGELTILFWDTLPTEFPPVTLTTRLALRKTASGVVITARVVDKSTGVTLYEYPPFTDGPGQDAPMPPPNPHGIGLWGTGFFPDEGAPYTDFLQAGVGVLQIIPTEPPPLEMRLDSLEYEVYALAYTNSVLLSWSPNMPGEQIVVGADAIEGPYVPWPEPMFERFGSLCVSVPATARQQFFTLVPGTQFSDDFEEPERPWASRSPWVINDTPKTELWPSNGVLRFEWPTTSGEFLMALPPEPNVELADIYSSIDILAWQTPEGAQSMFGVGGRLLWNTEGYLHGGGAMVVLNYPVAGKVTVATSSEGNSDYGPSLDLADSPPPYRVECWTLGTRYTGRLIHLASGRSIEVTSSYPEPTRGMPGIGVGTLGGGGALGSHCITLDNFFETGTKP